MSPNRAIRPDKVKIENPRLISTGPRRLRDVTMVVIRASVSINRTAASWWTGQGMTRSAHTPASLGTLRKARSQIEPGIGRGKAWNGRAGQALALVESGVVDRATANSSLRTATGHKQDDQTAKTKPPSGSCSRILDQSLGQRGPALQGTGRSNDPARWPGFLEGGLDDPRHSRQNQLTSHRTPDPNVDVPRFSHLSVESGSLSLTR